jgi:DEAD box ATP-dependent RNA helicase
LKKKPSRGRGFSRETASPCEGQPKSRLVLNFTKNENFLKDANKVSDDDHWAPPNEPFIESEQTSISEKKSADDWNHTKYTDFNSHNENDWGDDNTDSCCTSKVGGLNQNINNDSNSKTSYNWNTGTSNTANDDDWNVNLPSEVVSSDWNIGKSDEVKDETSWNDWNVPSKNDSSLNLVNTNFSDRAKGSNGKSRSCFKCGKEGHMSRDCPDSASSNRNGTFSDAKNCFKCGKVGHFARECTESDSISGENMTCFKCGNETHFARKCSNSTNYKDFERKDYSSESSFTEWGKVKVSKDEPSGSNKSGIGFKSDDSNENQKSFQSGSFRQDHVNKPRLGKHEELLENDETLFNTISAGINFERYDKILINITGKNPPKPINNFDAKITDQCLLNAVKKSGFSKPTPVQKYSIPIIMEKRNLMACAQTGSGKTLAFILPIFQTLLIEKFPDNYGQRTQTPIALIISPTRELATQIYKEAFKFSLNLPIKCRLVYGQTSLRHEIAELSKGTHVLVATPGRLLDFVGRGIISFKSLRYLILDEADRLIDQGFVPRIREMIVHPSMPNKENRITLMYSATFPDEVQRCANEFLAEDYLFLAVGKVGSANTDVTQTLLKVEKFAKRKKLLEILGSSETKDRTMIFVETKKTADFLASFLSQSSYKATSIHGGRYQAQREEALRDLKSGKYPILVATSVASRGLDIKDVCHVINYDLPKELDDYIHRIGRTGRVGNIGKATSFYDPQQDRPLSSYLVKILNDASQIVPDWLKEEACGESFDSDYRFGRTNIRNTEVLVF